MNWYAPVQTHVSLTEDTKGDSPMYIYLGRKCRISCWAQGAGLSQFTDASGDTLSCIPLQGGIAALPGARTQDPGMHSSEQATCQQTSCLKGLLALFPGHSSSHHDAHA